jgi:hypothetical protein
MLRLRGKVVSGLANFSQWIEGSSSCYEGKTGMRLYPGTLNVELASQASQHSLPADVICLDGPAGRIPFHRGFIGHDPDELSRQSEPIQRPVVMPGRAAVAASVRRIASSLSGT